MQRRIVRTRAAISVAFILASGLPRDGSAAPIELDNNVDVGWADECTGQGTLPPTLCSEPILVFGAPRFVPDARNVADQLEIAVDFLSVSFIVPPIAGSINTLFLNVGDAALNDVLLPGTDIPLRLAYPFQTGPGFVPADDVALNLTDFDGHDLLPLGDLFFTVSFNPSMGFIDRSPDRPDRAVIITLSGPGTVVSEPASLVLLLSGLASIGLGARWRIRGGASRLRR